MPNTFGTSALQVELVDPRGPRANRVRFRRDAVPELALANSLYVPSGRWPARGWILLTRADYDRVRGYGTEFRLSIDQFDPLAPGITFVNLVIVQARSVTTGLSASPEAVYLVELTDRRGVLANRWFQRPTNSYYNVFSPAYPTLSYTRSLNAGTAWDWNGMVGDLWNQQSAMLGAFAGLPITPAGTPRNFSLPGVGVWDAMNDILDHLGCTVAVDLRQGVTAPFTVVSRGAADATFTALQTKYAGRLEDDMEWIDSGSARVPGSVVVYFPTKYEQYGTEETVRRDDQQWSTRFPYPVTVAAPAAFTDAVGAHYLWDDFVVRVDVNGNPLAADVATASAIAAERTTQYYNEVYWGTRGFMHQVYTGLIPFQTGAGVDGVCWRQDFRGDVRGGWRTEIIRGPQPAWEVCRGR